MQQVSVTLYTLLGNYVYSHASVRTRTSCKMIQFKANVLKLTVTVVRLSIDF